MDFLRQLGILDPKNIPYHISVVGCGGIGSPTALMLAKISCPKLTLIDPDLVEDHNLPNQLYPISALEKPKVTACREMLLDFSSGCQVNSVIDKFTGKYCYPGIIISGVDSMKSRQEIWQIIQYNVDIPLYIDARIGAEIIQIFTIRPSDVDDVEFYLDFLFNDDQVEPLPCTSRAIMYTGFTVAGIIGAQLKKWLIQESFSTLINFDLKTMTISELKGGETNVN